MTEAEIHQNSNSKGRESLVVNEILDLINPYLISVDK